MNNISHEVMVNRLAKDGAEILESLSSFKCHLIHMAMGVAGEAGEVLLLVESPQEFTLEKLIEECGDLEFYLQGLRQALGVIYRQEEACVNSPVMDPAVGVSVRSCLLLDFIKKLVMYDKPFRPENIGQVVDLIRQVDGYLIMLYNDNSLTRDEVLRANIEKLGERFNGFNFTNEQAINRADKVGES